MMDVEWIANVEWINNWCWMNEQLMLNEWIVDVEWMKDYCELMNAYSSFHESFKMNNDPKTNKLMFKTYKKLNLILEIISLRLKIKIFLF